VVSDSHLSLQVRQGRKFKNAVSHLIDSYAVKVEQDEISVAGQLGWAKQTQMSPIKLMILRGVMLTFGRFFPNLIRKLLQKMLITGKEPAPFRFKRYFRWENNQWQITDELSATSWQGITGAGIGSDQTSIYVVMSRTFQRGQLQPWLDLTPDIKKLSSGQSFKIERSF
jgi:hypothetical protein